MLFPFLNCLRWNDEAGRPFGLPAVLCMVFGSFRFSYALAITLLTKRVIIAATSARVAVSVGSIFPL